MFTRPKCTAANGPLRNVQEFYATFDVKQGDKMFLPEAREGEDLVRAQTGEDSESSRIEGVALVDVAVFSPRKSQR